MVVDQFDDKILQTWEIGVIVSNNRVVVLDF